MDFGVDRLILALREQFGDRVGNAVLAIVGIVLVCVALWAIGTYGVLPVLRFSTDHHVREHFVHGYGAAIERIPGLWRLAIGLIIGPLVGWYGTKLLLRLTAGDLDQRLDASLASLMSTIEENRRLTADLTEASSLAVQESARLIDELIAAVEELARNQEDRSTDCEM